MKHFFRFPSRTRADVGRDVLDEFAFHLDMRVADLMRTGMPEAAARAQALAEFGDPARGASACIPHGQTIERKRRLHRVFSELAQDAHYGLRLIARNPGFSAVAILTLAVAIGGNTAIFGVVNALLFKGPAFAAPDRLARIYPGESQMSWPNYQDFMARTDLFTGILAHRAALMTLTEVESPVRLIGESVSPNYFAVLGAASAIGRTFSAGETRADLIVLSDRTWRGRFGADPAIAGRSIALDGRRYEIIGVMPRRFHGVAPPGLVREFWVPVDPSDRRLKDRAAAQFEVVGRLKPGVRHDQAGAEIRVIASGIRREHPELDERFMQSDVFAVDGFEAFRGMAGALLPVFAFLALMTIVAGFVLLIGCANIAGLLLGRAAARRREIAIRLALGAGRGRLVRQLLTESLMLALAGGTAGVVLAIWIAGSVNLFVSRLPFPMEFDLTLDRRVLAYGLGLSALTAVIFGLAPARRAARLELVPSLKDDAGGAGARHRMRHALVAGQVALCALLLVVGGLFTRSLANAVGVDPGFTATDVLVGDIDFGEADDSPDRSRHDAVFTALQQRVQELPGVQSAGMAWSVPLALMSRESFGVFVDGDAPTGGGRRVNANTTTPGWFRTVEIPVLGGRDFRWDDRAGAPNVAIVNETLARRFWNGDAVGRRMKIPARDDTWQSVDVVGVVADTKYWTIGETIEPAVYLPYAQHRMGGMNIFVRTSGMTATAAAIRREAQRIAPNLAVEITPMPEAIGVALMPARVGALFTAGFGVIAMLLSVLGVYGLVSFSVLQRVREIAIRKAVGARTAQIVRVVVGRSTALVAAGLVIGLGIGVLGGYALGGFIVNVRPFDPVTLIAASALVLTAALAASALPALRAARVDPLVTLRNE